MTLEYSHFLLAAYFTDFDRAWCGQEWCLIVNPPPPKNNRNSNYVLIIVVCNSDYMSVVISPRAWVHFITYFIGSSYQRNKNSFSGEIITEFSLS